MPTGNIGHILALQLRPNMALTGKEFPKQHFIKNKK